MLAVSFALSGAVRADDAGTENWTTGIAAGAPMDNILQVTMHDGDDMAPCWGAFPWSKDGEWIVYQSNRGEESNQICKMKSDGTTGWVELTNDNDEACDSHPSFVEPDHGHIVFQSDRDDEDYWGGEYEGNYDDGKADIFIMDEDGGDVELITTNEYDEFPPCYCGYQDFGYNKPVVSPDGTMIAYRSRSLLYVMNTDADGSDKRYPHQISGGQHACNHHTWFPDNQWVLYDAVWGELLEGEEGGGEEGEEAVCLDEEGKPVGRSIFKAMADGSDVEGLSDDNLVITGPDGEYIDTASNTYSNGNCTGWAAKGDTWAFASPDGQFIAYHTRYGVVREEGEDVYANKQEYSTLSIMNADGSDKRNLVVKGGGLDGTNLDSNWISVCGPKAWSPDSKWIAFKMQTTSHTYTSIFMINIDTLKIIQLTENYRDKQMWWNPNGSEILFSDRGDVTRDDQKHGDDLLVMNFEEGDNDNVINVEEWGPDSDDKYYDGNNDGTSDWKQSNVASLHNAGGEHYVTIEAPAGTTLQGVWTSHNPSGGPLPEGVTCPAGFFGFTVEGIAEGSTIVVKLILPAGLLPTSYWKYSEADGFVEFTYDTISGTGAVISGNVVSLHLTDGGRGDHDGIANGKIVDPGAPANFLAAHSIPTLNEWGLIIFMTLIGLLSIIYMKRKDIKAY